MISALFSQLNMEILICDTRSFHHLRLSQVCSFFSLFKFYDFLLYPSNISFLSHTPAFSGGHNAFLYSSVDGCGRSQEHLDAEPPSY